MYQTIQLTTGPMQALDITEKVRACVRESGVQNGICEIGRASCRERVCPKV